MNIFYTVRATPKNSILDNPEINLEIRSEIENALGNVKIEEREGYFEVRAGFESKAQVESAIRALNHQSKECKYSLRG
ncbi:MAG: hypothetical protein Q7S27_00150 [Nanoarchaeota archaeon]|nr:hypothetical protein [Nanoarchaeota archaeon]